MVAAGKEPRRAAARASAEPRDERSGPRRSQLRAATRIATEPDLTLGLRVRVFPCAALRAASPTRAPRCPVNAIWRRPLCVSVSHWLLTATLGVRSVRCFVKVVPSIQASAPGRRTVTVSVGAHLLERLARNERAVHVRELHAAPVRRADDCAFDVTGERPSFKSPAVGSA